MASAWRSVKGIFRRRAVLPSYDEARTSGSHVLSNSELYEEERLGWYSEQTFYSVRIGQVLGDRYLVIAKLGFGVYSTVWLCQDVKRNHYLCVKVCRVNSVEAARERQVYKHLNTIITQHSGSTFVRDMMATFEINTAIGTHICMVHIPLGSRLTALKASCPNQMIPGVNLKFILRRVLSALDYLHTDCNVTHGDIHPKNILLTLEDDKILTEIQKAEEKRPSPRKIDGNRVIHTSRGVRIGDNHGVPVICDFGEARVGDALIKAEVRRTPYRAPEVILQKEWGKKADIFSVGVMAWELSQSKHLFGPENENGEITNTKHLAHMVSMLGNPPAEFLRGSPTAGFYFDKNGSWIRTAEMEFVTLDSMIYGMDGEERVPFIGFLRKMIQWLPEYRASAAELLKDPWLNSSY